jgi:hypothetical protein
MPHHPRDGDILGVVEQPKQPEQGYHGGDFVQDEEGDDVGDRGAAQAGGVALQRAGQAGEDAVCSFECCCC